MPIVPVDDLDDARLGDYHHLRLPSRRMRIERDRGIFVVEGALSVEALLASAYVVRSVLVAEEHAPKMMARLGIETPLLTLPSAQMAELTGVQFHRGVLAAADRPELPEPADLMAAARRMLVLEGVNDHENIGALFRNAAAFGVDAVLLDPTSADPLYRRSTRVSLGHVLRVPFARSARWPDDLELLRRCGMATVALTPALDADDLADVMTRLPDRVALVVGAEGPGLSNAALRRTDHRARIPMANDVDSVNVATAAAIALSALWTDR